jgi:hypothetical protein
MVEDVVVVVTSLCAIFIPLVLIVLLPLAAYALYRSYARLKRRSAKLRRLAGKPS